MHVSVLHSTPAADVTAYRLPSLAKRRTLPAERRRRGVVRGGAGVLVRPGGVRTSRGDDRMSQYRHLFLGGEVEEPTCITVASHTSGSSPLIGIDQDRAQSQPGVSSLALERHMLLLES